MDVRQSPTSDSLGNSKISYILLDVIFDFKTAEGSIFIWDISMTRCIKKVEMPQIFDANKICVSDNDLIAIGYIFIIIRSNSGIVSLTDFSSLNSQPENLIIKDFKNITYPTNYICFNNKWYICVFIVN